MHTTLYFPNALCTSMWGTSGALEDGRFRLSLASISFAFRQHRGHLNNPHSLESIMLERNELCNLKGLGTRATDILHLNYSLVGRYLLAHHVEKEPAQNYFVAFLDCTLQPCSAIKSIN